MGLIAAEMRKLETVRTTWVITLIGVVLSGLTAALFLFESTMTGPFEGTDAQIANAIEQIGANSVIVVVIGLLSMTTEFRHGTAGRTFQLTPSRTRVMLAKLAVGAMYGVAFFALSLVAVFALVLIAGITVDDGLSFGSETAEALWQGPVGLALAAVLGVAVGALLRNQVVAITVTLVYLFLGETLVNQFFPEVARWMPFQALNSLYLSEEAMSGMPEGMVQPLDAATAWPVFLGYVAVFTAAAIALMRYRDV